MVWTIRDYRCVITQVTDSLPRTSQMYLKEIEMGIQVMVSLDLERGVSEEKRQKFNEYLENEHWVKVPKVTTTWRAGFTDGVTSESAARATKVGVANAARHAGITYYEAVMHFGPNQPTSFSN
jgi:hypothetical protein